MSIRKIEKFARKEKIDKLIKIADGKNVELATKAIEALATVKKDESFNYLVICLRNPNKDIRLAAIRGLGDIGFERCRTHLAHVIDTDTDKDIIEAAKEASLKIN
jgi:HEAT repeat protein